MSDERNKNGGRNGGEGGEIPMDPSLRAKITKESLMSMGDDRCPSCAAELTDSKAVVCVNCGYDLKANRKVRTRVGAIESGTPEETAFCRAGPVSWRVLLGAGALFILGAFALAWGDPPEGMRPAFYAIKTLVYAIVHVGLGIVAVVTTSMLLREKVGQIEYGVGWIAMGVGAFFLAIQIGQLLGAGPTAQWIVGAGLGAALYLGILWIGFRTSRDVVLMIAGLQFLFWLLLWIYSWVEDLAKVSG